MSFTIEDIDRCPHCNIADPNLISNGKFVTEGKRAKKTVWENFVCNSCGGVLLVEYDSSGSSQISNTYPEVDILHEAIPDRPHELLNQAISSTESNPVGSIVTSCAAIDAMLNNIRLHGR